MPLVFFVSPTDPRMLKTLDAIAARAARRRPRSPTASSTATTPTQPPDGLAGGEGTFNMCTFWLVEALTRAGRPTASSTRPG